MPYLSYLNIAAQLSRIPSGGVLYLVSDIMQLVFACKKGGEKLDANAFLDTLLEKIGPDGTLMIPAFNWDFCRGVPFDVRTAKSHVGVLGDIAATRPDFVRTCHPLYSFAVRGKHAQALLNASAQTCFGTDSPFAFMHRHDAQALVVGLSPTAGTTFVHYVEECMHVPYRYEKTFTGVCTNSAGEAREQTVRMLVRDLEIDPQYITGLDGVLTELGVSYPQTFNTVPFHTVSLRGLFPIAAADICFNDARHLYTYDRERFVLDYAPCRRFFP